MCRKPMFLISLVCFVGLSLPVSADNLTVDCIDTYTVSGTEEFDEIDVCGTLIVPTGATLVVNGESEVDGNGDDGEGGSDYAKIIVDGGTFIMNERLNLGKDHDAYLIVQNGGSVIHTYSKIAIPDNDGGVHRLIIIDGTVVSNEIDLSTDSDRLSGIQIACSATPGEIVAKLTMGNTDNGNNYDPSEMILRDVNSGSLYDYPEGACTGSHLFINDLGDDVKEVYYLVLGPCAWNPSPRDGATGIRSAIRDVWLSWEAGNLFGPNGRHQLYFGTDKDELVPATPSDPEYVGALRSNQLPVNVGPLPLWTTYYWKVDEFNTAPEPLTPACEVWSFTTGCVLPGDTNGDCLLNFLDYANVASTWQQEQFWP